MSKKGIQDEPELEEQPKTDRKQRIVRLKRQGDFNTLFATSISGDVNTDKFITVFTTSKAGVSRRTQLSTDSIEAIEETLET